MIHRLMTIQQAAAQVGRSTHTLRRLEAAGLIPRVARDRNGYRVYTEEDIRKIAAVIYPESPTAQRKEA